MHISCDGETVSKIGQFELRTVPSCHTNIVTTEYYRSCYCGCVPYVLTIKDPIL